MSRKDNESGLLAHLDQLMDDLHDNVPRAIKSFDADGIHDARVATRRLKAAMGVLESILSEDRRRDFEKVLKKVRRRLGPLRDLDVMIENLAKLESHPAHGLAATWLKGHLQVRREAERAASRQRAGSADVLSRLGAWWHVREQVIEASEAVDSLLAESLHLQLDAFAEQAGRIVEQMENSVPAEDRQDPHELRIAGKLLRYTLELAQSQGHQLPATVMRQFKQMQQSLGNWHDDIVMMQCAMRTSLDSMLGYHDLALQERVLELNRFFLRRAARELSSFAKLWQKRGADVAKTVRDKFSLTVPVPVTGLKMGPDPAGLDRKPVPAAVPQVVASGA